MVRLGLEFMRKEIKHDFSEALHLVYNLEA
jgi:hypothetical protein